MERREVVVNEVMELRVIGELMLMSDSRLENMKVVKMVFMGMF